MCFKLVCVCFVFFDIFLTFFVFRHMLQCTIFKRYFYNKQMNKYQLCIINYNHVHAIKKIQTENGEEI